MYTRSYLTEGSADIQSLLSTICLQKSGTGNLYYSKRGGTLFRLAFPRVQLQYKAHASLSEMLYTATTEILLLSLSPLPSPKPAPLCAPTTTVLPQVQHSQLHVHLLHLTSPTQVYRPPLQTTPTASTSSTPHVLNHAVHQAVHQPGSTQSTLHCQSDSSSHSIAQPPLPPTFVTVHSESSDPSPQHSRNGNQNTQSTD